MKRVIVSAPVWNEGDKIGRVVSKIPRDIVDTILVVDDGSTDNSASESQKNGAIVVKHKRNMGVGAAIRTGISFGIKENYEVIVIISGADKSDPSEISRLLMPIFEADYDFVQGSRYLKGGKGINTPLHRSIGTRMYTYLFSFLSGIQISDASSGIRAFKTSIFKDKRIDIWQEWLNGYELEPYLYYKVIKLGYKVIEIPITIRYPQGSNTSWTKMKPILGWWSITKPLIYCTLGIKK